MLLLREGGVRVAAAAGFLLAVALMVVGVSDGDSGDCAAFRVGLLLSAVAGVGLMLTAGRVTDEVVERARQDGYDDGYRDGQEATRAERSSDGPVRAFRRAPHQLGQQRDLRRGADRVG